MKKTHRALLSILLVLALLATLPLTAMATTTDMNEPYNATSVSQGNTLTTNHGQVSINKGTVVTNESVTVEGSPPPPVYSGYITENEGTVQENNNGGYVKDNNNGGEVTNNNAGAVVENNNNGGEVTHNNADAVVKNNNDGGTVVNNHAGGEVTYNAPGGVVTNNSGTVGVAPSAPLSDGGTNESAPSTGNSGTVVTNNIDGVVYNNVGNEANGVGTNYGTVHQKQDDGTYITYYGLQGVDDEENGAQRYLGSHASNDDGTFDLDGAVTAIERKGYKLISYTPYTYSSSQGELVAQTSDNPIYVGEDSQERAYYKSYTLSAPTLLKLVWEKITSVFTPAASSGGGGGAEVVELSARKRYIGLGSVIFINEKGYKVVELKDDAYVVVSFDALSDEDVKDLDALFAKLFTAEQQKQIKNVGQLLDAEDVLTVFGKPGNHPVFEISKTLVE